MLEFIDSRTLAILIRINAQITVSGWANLEQISALCDLGIDVTPWLFGDPGYGDIDAAQFVTALHAWAQDNAREVEA